MAYEGLILLSFTLVYLAINVAGIPGAGACGIWITVDVARTHGALIHPLPIVLVGVAGGLWLILLVFDMIIWFQYRSLVAELSFSKASIDDAYMKFEEEDVAVFTLDEDEEEELEKEKPKAKSVKKQEDVEEAEIESSKKPPLPSHTPMVLQAEDAGVFGGGEYKKKHKKKGKKSKKTRDED